MASCMLYSLKYSQEWINHFENVPTVNQWDNDAKALWLRVHLIGRAQPAYKQFSTEQTATYTVLKAALQELFKPASTCEYSLYETKFAA